MIFGINDGLRIVDTIIRLFPRRSQRKRLHRLRRKMIKRHSKGKITSEHLEAGLKAIDQALAALDP